MIGDAANDDGLAIVVRKNAAQVAMEILAQGRFAEQWPAFLRREDRVNEDFGEGLWHGVRNHRNDSRHEPMNRGALARQRLGLRQPSGAFDGVRGPKRQRTAAVQDLAAIRRLLGEGRGG